MPNCRWDTTGSAEKSSSYSLLLLFKIIKQELQDKPENKSNQNKIETLNNYSSDMCGQIRQVQWVFPKQDIIASFFLFTVLNPFWT